MTNRQVTTSEAIYRVLDDSLNEAFIESVMSKYNTPKARKTIIAERGLVRNPNLFTMVHLYNSDLLGESRLATRTDLEKAMSAGLSLKGENVLFGLAVVNTYVSHQIDNATSAVNIASQLTARRLSWNRLISLADLTMREDPRSGHGVTLFLKEDALSESFPRLDSFSWRHRAYNGVSEASFSAEGSWSYSGDEITAHRDNNRIVVVDRIA